MAQLLYNISYIIKIINSNENTNPVSRINYVSYCYIVVIILRTKKSNADIAFVVLNTRQSIDLSLKKKFSLNRFKTDN